MTKQFAGFQGAMATTLNKLNDLEAWRTIAETSMGTMMQQSKETTTRVQQLEARPPPPPPPLPIPLPTPPLPQAPAALRPAPPPGWFDLNAVLGNSQPSSSSQSPNGHGQCIDNRVVSGGVLGLPPPRPVTGTPHDPPAAVVVCHDLDWQSHNRSLPTPKMDFPKFSGDNPRLWRDQCIMYFEVNGIPPVLMTRFATLSFQGSAATWLQTVERRGRVTDWDKLCELVFAKFDKDQYQNHLQQLESLKQTGSVQEYHAQFEKLAHGILLYNPTYDDVFFVTRFLSRLKEEIRAPLMLHRPGDVDPASTLATLQEEELKQAKTRSLGRGFTKNLDRNTYLKNGEKVQSVESDDKVATLEQYRRKNGLYFKCGDWLESVSPVWVDFKSKAMRITHKRKRIALQGVQDNTAGCLPIPAKKLQGLIRGGGAAYCIKMFHDPPHAVLSDDQQYICSIQTEDMPAVPTEVQELIQQYEHLFATPTELPPARLADDQINLMPGAQPVRVRPYHYSPIQKTEIETQVKEMLNNGVVRPSASAFASPVQLQVFDILHQNKFYIKKSKCFFAQPTVEYLGHIISAEGVATDPTKIAAVQNWPTPKTVKQLKGFVGLTGYYRRFIQHYGIISRPLTEMLKKGQSFHWNSDSDRAFQLLKQKMIQAPVLAVPNFGKTFVLETDASDLGIGAVLMQENHPIAYLSKHLCSKNQALSIYEKECLAILMDVDRWRPYLQHNQFLIRTDHKCLLHLTEQRVASRIHHKAMVKLMDFKYQIQYKKGINNAAADALSRCVGDEEVNAISECVPAWIAKVYLDNIYKLHGLPKAMISDRDPVFATYHSAIGHSPSEVLYGHNPRHFGISNLQMCSVPELEQWLKERELLSRVIQLQLTRAQQRMKSQADKKRSERSFQPGDMVYMKLKPYVQSTAAARPNKKLSFRYYGPYRVLERIREVAYRLDLPAHSRINPVLHVSQLKKQVAAGCEISDDLSTVCTDPATVLQLEKTLDRRMIQRGAEAVKQVKIKWTYLPEAMATWEDATAYEECDDFLA
ncbi:uncharacterized protein [Miscanthus floridulus]|uniref:uncharacterized protein n=1 Tax=Miscanthus floridulus TaxID=154761 RepID=UPI00345A44C7